MLTKTSLTFLLLITSFSKFSFAQTSLDDLTNKFFDIYKIDGSDKAIDYLFATNKNIDDYKEAIDDVKKNLNQTYLIDGQYWGYDLLSKKRAGDNFIMFTFLVRHEKDPITFRIIFYKPHDKWQVQNFKFNNKMDEELEEASKGYRFKENLEN